MILRLSRTQGRTILRLLDQGRTFQVPNALIAGHIYPSHQRHLSSSIVKQQQQTPTQTLGKVEPKLSMTFTCSVTDCGHRSTHEFTRRSYEKGIVIVQCPNCMNRHLIADHLSWFTENASDPKTIEQMIEAKGGKVKRGLSYIDGIGHETVEMFGEAEEEEPVKS